MKDVHKELVIKTAIQEYKNSVLFGFSSSTAHAINLMEDAYDMCSIYNIEGIAELEKTIKQVKEKYKKELNNCPICNVGDKIYAVVPDKDNGYIAKEVEVYEISWNQNGMFYKTYPSLPDITQDAVGKTVFLTQQSANNRANELTAQESKDKQDIESYLDSNEPLEFV